jgi:hypothetical protein
MSVFVQDARRNDLWDEELERIWTDLKEKCHLVEIMSRDADFHKKN